MSAKVHVFADRSAAGIELARAVVERRPRSPIVVLGLPRGGVPVAYEVARALHARHGCPCGAKDWHAGPARIRARRHCVRN